VLCPFCGKGPIQLDTRVCDRCGKDISNFWSTLKFLENQSLLRKPVQQMALDEQKKTKKAFTERTSLETRLSVLVPQLKPDAITTRTQADSTRLTGKVRKKSKLAETVPRAELEIKESETENLTQDKGNLMERVRDLEAQLVKSVSRTRLEAEQSETENLRTELSRLRDDKAQLEAKIQKLSADLAEALQSTPASKLVESEVHPQTTPFKLVTPLPQQSPEMTLAVTGGRPLGVTILSAFYTLSAIVGMTTIPLTFMLEGNLNYLSAVGMAALGSVLSTVFPFLSILQIISVLTPLVLAYGLLKALDWARVIVRVLAALAVAGILASAAGVILFVNELNPSSVGMAYVIYIILAFATMISLVIPVVIFRYTGRPHVRRYFAARLQKGAEEAARLEKKCAECGFNNRVDANFCTSCGASLSTGPSMHTGTSMVNLDRFSKMKSMPESGVVKREQSESQKNITLSPPIIHPGDMLETRCHFQADHPPA
jgi:hypothetical protein